MLQQIPITVPARALGNKTNHSQLNICYQEWPHLKPMPIWTPNDELFYAQKIPSRKKQRQCMMLGFCRKADENCALRGYYAESK